MATPIEESVNGVEHMLYMSSSATGDGALAITVTFEPGTDVDQAQVLVQNRVATAEPRLPEEVRQIGVTVRKNSPDILMVATLISPDASLPQQYLSNYATLQLLDRLSRVPGVGSARLFGGRDFNMRIWIDPDRAASLDLTVDEVVAASARRTCRWPPARWGSRRSIAVAPRSSSASRRKGRLQTPEEFRDIIVKTDATGRATRLGDLARIELGAQDYSINAYLSGSPTIAIAISQLPGSNALTTAEAVREELATAAQGVSAGHGIPHSLQPHRVHREVDLRGRAHVVRSGGARGAGGAGVPAELAGGAHSDHRDSDLADRHRRGARGVRVLAQQPVAVRAGAGHRHRRGRCHRGRREHLATDGGEGHLGARGRARDHGRSVRRAHRHCAGADGRVHSHCVHPGHLRAVLSAVRAHHRELHGDLGVRVAHAVAGARGVDPEAEGA